MSIPWVRPGYGYRSSVVEQVGLATFGTRREAHVTVQSFVVGVRGARTFMASLVMLGVRIHASGHAAITLTPAGTAQGLILTTFSSGYPQADGVGPLGIGFTSSNGVIVSDKFGDVHLFPTNADNQVCAGADASTVVRQRQHPRATPPVSRKSATTSTWRGKASATSCRSIRTAA